MYKKFLFLIFSSIASIHAMDPSIEIGSPIKKEEQKLANLHKKHRLMTHEQPVFKNSAEEATYHQQTCKLSAEIITISQFLENALQMKNINSLLHR